MKCRECEREAVWLVKDLAPYDEYYLPLCGEHFQEVIEMEGEMNLDFDLIVNIDLEDVISETSKQSVYWAKKQHNTVQELVKWKEKYKTLEKIVSPKVSEGKKT